MVKMPSCDTNDPLPPSDVQSPLTGVTPIANDMPHSNTPNQVTYIPNDPDSDPRSFDLSLSDSSDSSDYGYLKQAQRTRKKSLVKKA